MSTYAATLGRDFWLAKWTSQSASVHDLSFVFFYGGLSLLGSLFLFMKEVSFALAGLSSCQSFHNRLLASLLKAPMSFFDTTPIGRIMVRFSTDIDNLDIQLSPQFSHISMNIFMLVSTLIVLVNATVWLIIPLALIAFAMMKLQQFYLGASRDLNRLKSITQSPAISLVSETLSGLSTVRAYGLENHFTRRIQGTLLELIK